MEAVQLIEDIITREVRGLCTTCVHAGTCAYFLSSDKTVIQCELFQLDHTIETYVSVGLCKTCDQLSTCKLPGRRTGVWHCDEFI